MSSLDDLMTSSEGRGKRGGRKEGEDGGRRGGTELDYTIRDIQLMKA